MKNSNANPLFTNGQPRDDVAEFVDWLVTPPDMRQPATQAAWARDHGLSPLTVADWKKDDRVKRLISAKADTLNMSPERVQEVMDALFKRAKTGDTQAAKLYMDQVARLQGLQAESVGGYEDMTDEQLLALADELVKAKA